MQRDYRTSLMKHNSNRCNCCARLGPALASRASRLGFRSSRVSGLGRLCVLASCHGGSQQHSAQGLALLSRGWVCGSHETVICIFKCLSTNQPVYMFICLSVSLSSCLHLSTYLSINSSVCPFTHLPIYLDNYLSTYLSTYLYIYLSTYLPPFSLRILYIFHGSTYLSTYPSS